MAEGPLGLRPLMLELPIPQASGRRKASLTGSRSLCLIEQTRRETLTSRLPREEAVVRQSFLQGWEIAAEPVP